MEFFRDFFNSFISIFNPWSYKKVENLNVGNKSNNSLCALSNHKFSSSLHLIEDAPARNGGHTDYALHNCTRCSVVTIFDKANYESTTDDHKDWLKSELSRLGKVLVHI